MHTTSDIKSSPEYAALLTRLSNRPSISATEVSSIARAVTKPTANNFQAGCAEDDLEKYLWRAWGAIVQFAADTPHEQQDALVEVVKMIRKTDLTAGDLQVARVWGARVWKGAPLLGATMRESWDRAPGLAAKDAWTSAQWTNLNAFAARLTAIAYSPSVQSLNFSRSISRAPSTTSVPSVAGSRAASPGPAGGSSNHPFDFALYGLWTMRTAFESGSASTNGSAANGSGSMYEVAAVDAAEAWTTYAGSVLIKLSLQRHEFDGRTGTAGQAVKDKQWNGYSRERLAFWLEHLEKAKEEEDREGRRGRNGLLDPSKLPLR